MKVMCTHNFIRTVITLFISRLATLLKLSWVVGSAHTIMFSASSICMPLVGLFGNVLGASVVWSFLFLVRIMSAPFSLSSLAFYVPGYSAALYLASDNKIMRCGIAGLCMVLFLVHPVGYYAAPYVLYWIIPVIVGLGSFESIYTRALGATFTAHAVGSVIWLYTVPMAATEWLSLIPIVALERLTFAAGLVVMYHFIIASSGAIMRVKKNVVAAFSLIR